MKRVVAKVLALVMICGIATAKEIFYDKRIFALIKNAY